MKILVVCLGNICRSPVAEGVLRKIIEQKGLGWEVDSAGTSSAHRGQHPDSRSSANALSNGVDIRKLVSRPFVVEDFDYFDKILVMDVMNLRDVLSMARNKEEIGKVDLLLNQAYPGEDRSVPDPYYGGERGFQEVFNLVWDACALFVQNHHRG